MMFQDGNNYLARAEYFTAVFFDGVLFLLQVS